MNTCPEFPVLEGRAWSSEVNRHVAGCGSCRLVMELIDERSQAAASRDRRTECIRFEALIAVRVAGELRGPASAMLDEHVRDCADCRDSTLTSIDPSAYALGAEVARGGMGRIVAARDLRIGRPVAVKELLSKTTTQAARFEREARVTARLQHPGIVPIYEIGKWESGTPFYAMRMVAGRTLRSALAARATLEARLALLPSVIAAAEAVAFAHAHQVIHRDLTPANIMVGDYGETVVIDWGLAKDLTHDGDDEADAGPYRRDPAASPELTAAGAVIGTAAYMPPEQAAGERVDTRADVYALGSILYHLLAGQAPYRGGSSEDVLRRVQIETPDPLPAAAPRDLASIVAKAMARSPDDRYPSAREFAAELTGFQAGRLVAAHEYTRGELIRRWVRRRRGIVAVVAIATVALAVFGAFAIRRIVDERDAADQQRVVADAERSVAQRQRAQSESLAVTLLAEQGRQELLAGNSTRALPYLSAAYSQGDTSADTRFMIAAAMHEVDGRERVLIGTSTTVADLAFSSDGERLGVVKGDTVETWDLARGTAGPTLHADRGIELTEAVFSPDGKTIAAIAGDQQNRWPAIFVFDVASGAVRKLVGHTHSSTRPLFTPDGKYLVTVSWDSTWRRWDLATGEVRTVKTSGPPLYGRRGPVGSGAPALDATGERLLTMNWQGKLELWDVATGARLWELDSKPTYAASLHPDGTRVLTCNLDEVVLWDIATKKVIARRRGPEHHLVRCAFRPDGKAILVAGDRSEVVLWDATLGAQIASVREEGDLIIPMFAGRDRIVISRTFNSQGTSSVWDLGLEAPVTVIHGGVVTVASADGRRLATSRGDGSVEVWRIDRGRLARRFTTTDIAEANVSLDGSRVVAVSASGAVRIHAVDREGVQLPHAALRKPVDVANGNTAATTPDGEAIVLDASGATLQRFAARAPVTGVELTEDGTRVLVTTASSSELREVATGRVIANIPVAGKVSHVSGDGSRVIVLADKLVVWDTSRGVEIARIELAAPVLFDLIFVSRDGRRFAVPYLKRSDPKTVDDSFLTLELYDADSGRSLASVVGAVFPTFSAANDRMFAAGIDGQLHVLRLADGKDLARLPGQQGFGTVQITADGTRLALATTDGVAEIRSVVDGRPLYRFKMRAAIPEIDAATRSFTYNLTIANGFNGIRDDLFVTGNENGSAIATWDIHLETRKPAEIAKLVEERVPWRLEGGRLVRRDVMVSRRSEPKAP